MNHDLSGDVDTAYKCDRSKHRAESKSGRVRGFLGGARAGVARLLLCGSLRLWARGPFIGTCDCGGWLKVRHGRMIVVVVVVG